ncbi:hypothetical protein LUX09_00115 [Streptomyces albogriseolus]|nr:hypothetical protein [Streptomyces albogriseolus]
MVARGSLLLRADDLLLPRETTDLLTFFDGLLHQPTYRAPYDFSPARIRYEERVIELLHSADQDGDTPRTC